MPPKKAKKLPHRGLFLPPLLAKKLPVRAQVLPPLLAMLPSRALILMPLSAMLLPLRGKMLRPRKGQPVPGQNILTKTKLCSSLVFLISLKVEMPPLGKIRLENPLERGVLSKLGY